MSLRSQPINSPVFTHPLLPGSSSWANKEAERKPVWIECSPVAQSLTQVLWFHSRSRIRLEVLRILFTFQMKTLRFRDTMSFAQDHRAQEGMSWYQNPWLPGLKDGGVSSLLRSWEAYTERQWDSSSPDLGLTNFTSFLKNLALRTSALLPLISVALQTSKSVTKNGLSMVRGNRCLQTSVIRSSGTRRMDGYLWREQH